MKTKYKHLEFREGKITRTAGSLAVLGKIIGKSWKCFTVDEDGKEFYIGEFVYSEYVAFSSKKYWMFNSNGWLFIYEEQKELMEFWKQLRSMKYGKTTTTSRH